MAKTKGRRSYFQRPSSYLAPQVGLRHDQHFPTVFALFCILLKILPGWCFTPFTLSTPSAPRCALVVTGIEDLINRSHPSRHRAVFAESWARHPESPLGESDSRCTCPCSR